MIDALLLFGVLCGLAGAWRGNRTSAALLASAGLTSLFAWLGVPFVWPVWVLIDLAVVGVISWRPMKYSDCPVVALFIAAWALYPSVAAGDRQASELIAVVVAAQFILSAPWRWALHKLHLRRADLDAEGEFLRVMHGAS